MTPSAPSQASEEAKTLHEQLDRKLHVFWTEAGDSCPWCDVIAHALARVSRQALERAATLIDSECTRVLSKQTAGKSDPRYEDSVNLNLRMMAVLLPDLAASVRALIPGEK